MLNGLFRAFDFLIEIGPHFEYLVELGVIVLQHFEDFIAAQQDYFDLQRNRCRSQRNGSEAGFLGNIFKLQILGLQGSLEGFIDKRVHQNRFDVHDQKAAVGMQQRTGLYQGEIRGHRSHVGPFFNAAEDVVVGGVGFDGYRRSL